MSTSLAPRIRRAVLYLQGFDRRKITKASTHPTLDCACLDMEDGVALTKKDDAREGIVQALENVEFGRTERLVRINGFHKKTTNAAPDFGGGVDDIYNFAERDLDAILSSRVLPDGIVIPKVEAPVDVLRVSEELDALGDRARNIRVICMIESAKAMLNMPQICSACPQRMDCVIFGADDYASNVGAIRTKEGDEMNYARNTMFLNAAAYNISAIDMVQIDYHDMDQLTKESRQSYHLGFVGKQVIHPNQIDPVQEAYSPTEDAINHASAVVVAHDQHEEKGHGAFAFDGLMIDMPTVLQYKRLLERARQMGLYDS